MSGLPPQLTTEPGTPAREWARSTTTAAFARTEPAPAISNPGHVDPAGGSISSANDAQKGAFDPSFADADVPGAYPVTPGDYDPTRQASLQETAQAAAGQASSFVQTAATTAAQYLPKGVIDTVSSYIPTTSATATMSSARASEHDHEHTTSFPTKELSGASTSERVGGVGSLPGPVKESGVTKLPDERADEERYATMAGAAAAVAGGAYALKDRIIGSVPSQDQANQTAQNAVQAAKQTVQSTAQTAKQAVPGVQSNSTAVTASTLPAHEPFGAQPGDRSLGVGALPGNQSESHVALLPEESAHPQYDSGPIGTAAQVALKPSEEERGNEAATGQMRNVAGVGALVGGRSEEGVARLPDERSTTNTGSQQGVGAVVGSRDEQGKQTVNAVTGTSKPPAPPAKDESATKMEVGVGGHKGQPNQGPGYDTDYHPAKLHPPTSTSGAADLTQHASEGEKSLGATQADANRPPEAQRRPHSGNSPSPSQKERKATFMEKMKGEAKVLMGKIEGKHDKVEQGQRIKRGEATA